MPCQLCKSPLHTLARCTIHLDEHWAPIRKIVRDEPFALRKHYELISLYTVPILNIMNRRLGFITVEACKSDLVYNIVLYFFQRRIPNNQILNQADPANIANVSDLVEAYVSLLMWRTTSEKKLVFRESAFSWLDMYYRNAFCPEYIQLLQNNVVDMQHHQWHLAMILTEQARQELRAIGTLTAIELGMVIERDPEKAHLKKLKIKVKIDKHMDFKECFMCYDVKPILMLGCDHEYCADCLVGTAKVRTKTFITCAVCRSEIKEVKVLTKELKEDLMNQLKKE